MKQTCLDPADLEKQLTDTRRELEITEGALRQCIADNASASITEDEYRLRYDSLYEKFQGLEKKKNSLSDKLTVMQTEAVTIDEVIACLETTDTIPMEFDPMLWRITVEKVLVGNDGVIRFILVGGKEYSFTIY